MQRQTMQQRRLRDGSRDRIDPNLVDLNRHVRCLPQRRQGLIAAPNLIKQFDFAIARLFANACGKGAHGCLYDGRNL